MESLKKILVFLIAGFYLFLSTGVTLLQTHCLCSDSTSISLYAASESCTERISDHDSCEENSNCADSSTASGHDDCGCDAPVVTYLKLTNHLGDGSNLEYPLEKHLSLIPCSEIEFLRINVLPSLPIVYPDYSPPENPLYGRYLISFLNQRKIALTA